MYSVKRRNVKVCPLERDFSVASFISLLGVPELECEVVVSWLYSYSTHREYCWCPLSLSYHCFFFPLVPFSYFLVSFTSIP